MIFQCAFDLCVPCALNITPEEAHQVRGRGEALVRVRAKAALEEAHQDKFNVRLVLRDRVRVGLGLGYTGGSSSG